MGGQERQNPESALAGSDDARTGTGAGPPAAMLMANARSSALAFDGKSAAASPVVGHRTERALSTAWAVKCAFELIVRLAPDKPLAALLSKAVACAVCDTVTVILPVPARGI